MTPPAGGGALWGLVAAAGAGARFGPAGVPGGLPKQYAELDGRPLAAHAVERLAADGRVGAVVVVLPQGGGARAWTSFGLRFRCEVLLAEGGADRARSVRNGLRRLLGEGEGEAAAARMRTPAAAPDDHVLVHDAARPCLHPEDLAALVDAGLAHPTGALLAAPVHDTLKRARPMEEAGEAGRGQVRAGAGSGRPAVEATVPRERLWRALTPQMFRIGPLAAALERAFARNETPTDDSQAMEGWAAAEGLPPPILVEALRDNPKVTTPADLETLRRRFARERAG